MKNFKHYLLKLTLIISVMLFAQSALAQSAVKLDKEERRNIRNNTQLGSANILGTSKHTPVTSISKLAKKGINLSKRDVQLAKPNAQRVVNVEKAKERLVQLEEIMLNSSELSNEQKGMIAKEIKSIKRHLK